MIKSSNALEHLTSNNTGSGSGDRGRIVVHSAKNDGTAYEAGKIEIDRSSGTGTTAHMLFATNNGSSVTEHMRITSDGRVGIGDSTPTAGVDIAFDTQQVHALQIRNSNSSAGGGKYIQFAKANGDFTGSVTQSSDQNTVSFNTSSDYRLKENVSYNFDATSRLKQLKPVRFNWISDENNTTIDGFIAHEVSGIVPEAITGEKDAMTEEVLYVDGDVIPDGKKIGDVKKASVIDPQGIDQSKLVPLLTKALQEAFDEIDILKTKVEALET